ncbi:hypothetical protein F4680DRAFT_455891 [Xylaria scruposa]|nr:hypothetical protein F4680DRAFT_455891 [Xylaria scruposa]
MEYIINHVILPPQLPQKDDYSSVNEKWLLHHVFEAFKHYRTTLQDSQAGIADPIATQRAFTMLKNLKRIYNTDKTSNPIDEEALTEALGRLHEDVAPIPLYVRAQNAGVMISSVSTNDMIQFELFELSPLNKAPMSITGRLQRIFPGCAISVAREEVQKPSFLKTITDTLSRMSHQPAYGTTPTVRKAGELHQEDRDTTNPKMITELLAAYLRSIGEMVEVSSILKNTRQDVLWKNARSPWHRSALWLLIRVALQLFLSRQESDPVEQDIYKNYMLFFAGYILQQAQKYMISTDLIWTIKAKVTRRRLKIGVRGHPDVLRFVDNILSEAESALQTRWLRIQSDDTVHHNFGDLQRLKPAQDTVMQLNGLDRYLEAIKRRKFVIARCTKPPTSCPLPVFTAPLNECFDKFPDTPTIFKLLRFESWVESCLDEWLIANPGNDECCRDLRLVIESYHKCAIGQYQHNAEATSTMLLTIIRLWVALDKSAISCCNILADYAPGLPAGILQKLILPERWQMKRLHSIEQYLDRRYSRAKFSPSYVFSSFGHKNCFAVQYFNQSEKHQDLLSVIELNAHKSRNEKCAELNRKRVEYNRHETEYNRLECRYTEWLDRRTGILKQKHKKTCDKCNHMTAMKELQIDLHEWPLPENKNEAKTIVFELLVPSCFGNWRDSTIFTLMDVLRLQYVSRVSLQRKYTIEQIEGLGDYFKSSGIGQRITLRSEIKPHSRTHRSIKSVINVPIEEILVKNGASFRYFDDVQGCLVSDISPSASQNAYAFRVSTASEPLQQFLDGTIDLDIYANAAIAHQSGCPKDLSLEEYKGMASLQAGGKIRWQNVMRELVSPSIDFRKEDTVIMILQCIQQTGQPDARNALRETHNILDDDRFSAALLGHLSDACDKASGNWQCAPALSAFVSIANRVLSLSTAPDIQQLCLNILSTARATSISWLKVLKQNAEKATESRLRDEFLSKSVFVALLCTDTFNIDSRKLRKVLSEPKQAAILIRANVVIQEGRNEAAQKPYSLTAILYHRWKQLCYRSFPILAEQIVVLRSPALDEAIKVSWAAYQPTGQWHALKKPYDHWLHSRSAPNKHESGLIVYFSMLTGELLVNGAPVNRLPIDYERNTAYQTLFGNSAIDAMPSSERGMRFSGNQTFAGYKLHFNLGTERDTLPETCLIVQASNGNSTFQFIPPSLLRQDFPVAFVENFVHWYNETGGYVEFRPRDRAWFHSDDNWKLRRTGKAKKAWRLNKAEKSLVKIQSPTATRFYNVFQALEDIPYIHVIFDRKTSTLQIDLPRLQLSFYATTGDSSIKSHQHRGMSVHAHQGIGALVGLKSKLVLKSNTANSRDKIIIPNGKVSHHQHNGHIRVTIDRSSSTKTHVYEIDRELGRIIDNGTLTSKLFLAYIYGVTSFCLHEPLIGLTGTNAALTILNSAAVRSFPAASQDDIDLLAKILSLTPRREYYPENLQEMETVHWSSELGFLAQHSGYYESVISLLEHLKSLSLFHPRSGVRYHDIYEINKTLLRREKIRSAIVRTWDFGASCYEGVDEAYSSRDRSQNSNVALQALSLSSFVFRGEGDLRTPTEENIESDLKRFFHEKGRIVDLGAPSPPESFKYDAAFLIESSNIISGEFLARLKALKSQTNRIHKYGVMMWLATLSFAKSPDFAMLEILALLFICHRTTAIEAPNISFIDMSYGFQIQGNVVRENVSGSMRSFAETPDAKLMKHLEETDQQCWERRQSSFEENRDRTVNRFVQEIIRQWPCENPKAPSYRESYSFVTYIDVRQAMSSLEALFRILNNNRRLKRYIFKVACAPRTSVALDAVVRRPIAPKPAGNVACGFVRTNDLFSGPAPLRITNSESTKPNLNVNSGCKKNMALLPDLLQRLDEMTDSPFEVDYMARLRDSLLTLHKLEYGFKIEQSTEDLYAVLIRHQEVWKRIVDTSYSAMVAAVAIPIRERFYSHNENAELKLPLQHFPQTCPVFFLQYLSQKRWKNLSSDWKKCLIQYGLALTQLQQANRFLDAVDNPASLIKELRNSGHDWDPYEYPESLLLEIENGILIRDIQQRVACEMRNPPSGENAVMQLNMGEGKSSVIVPIVATSLADGNRLVRVVVAKPQSKQMLQMLVAKLGGLLDRQIYHLPFSRDIKLDDTSSRKIAQLLEKCMRSGGILLTQPENILSFMLMGIESCISGKLETSQALTKTLRFLDTYSRDIVDESDENFSVKFELLYTMGLQLPIQYGPQRWICVQYVLGIFSKIVSQVTDQFPLSIEIHSQPSGGFPRTRILRVDAQRHILVRIAEEVCKKGLIGFPIVRQRKELRQAVLSYITDVQPSPAVISMVEDDCPTGFWAKSREALLLLRGLLAGGILSFCFGQKRWRVDYGLDPSRRPETKLALPFRAKDSPTPRSEFSHPDVVIVLTQLSYYYGGLSNQEIDWTFRHLLNSDQADSEFRVWVRETNKLSDEFKQLSGINLDDRAICEEEIFPHFRFSRCAINYYLSKNVFPKEMKEFQYKLSASGWDIGKLKTLPLTGFSGTNDSRAVLPLSVNQLDLPEQQHTNALVLEYLLQPENSVALYPSSIEGEVSDAKTLLDMVIGMDPPVRVILDVGAQILELDNLEVAREWLSSFHESESTEAVVFFDKHDELSVVDREGRIEPLQVSPYMNQLDLCLVFLDQSHTRGTELKLPRNYRAAVTLGAGLTKDRLVQACMRMRLLGEGQSVVFCVPQEIVSKIQQRLPGVGSEDEPTISVSDILAWAITETWEDTKHNILLWAAQGRRHRKHKSFWAQCRRAGDVLTEELAEEFLEDEAMSLEDRYRPLQDQGAAHEFDDAITRRCQQFNNLESISSVLQEEQERELAPEIEQERQNERPPPAKPEQHSVHQDIRKFVATGQIVNSSEAYMSAFASLQETSVVALFDISKFRPGLLVSADFARTVKIRNPADKLDAFQRPVQWVLTASQSLSAEVEHMMVVSPYEANELLPMVQELEHVALHLYAPRPNLGYRSLDKLDLYTVPEALKDRTITRRFITELNLFAGQLYISSFDDYIDICKFLGLAWEPAKDGEVIGADGFIHLDHAGRIGGESGLPASPVEFFKALFTNIRRNCETIDKTHMGQVLDNRLLSPEDFE